MVILDFPIHEDNLKWLIHASQSPLLVEHVNKKIPGLSEKPLGFIYRMIPKEANHASILKGINEIQRFRMISSVYPVVVTIEAHLSRKKSYNLVVEKIITVHNSEWLTICDMPLIADDQQLTFKVSRLVTALDLVVTYFRHWPCQEPDFNDLKAYYDSRGFRLKI